MDTDEPGHLQAAGNLQDSFIKQLEDAGAKSSATKTDVDELTDSILATGDKSTSTQAARAQLIKDLENAGINAQKATTAGRRVHQVDPEHPLQQDRQHHRDGHRHHGRSTRRRRRPPPRRRRERHPPRRGRRPGLRRLRASRAPTTSTRCCPTASTWCRPPRSTSTARTCSTASTRMHFADGGYRSAATPGACRARRVGRDAVPEHQRDSPRRWRRSSRPLSPRGRRAATSGRAPIIVNFIGTQMPTPEQSQALMTQLSAAVGVS